MPDFVVTSPTGQKFKWTGDKSPTADDLATFEKQQSAGQPPTKAPTPTVNAAASKATSVGPAPGLLETGKRQLKAVGRTLKESLPLLGGAAGGALAAAAATPTGPVGMATAGVAGAGAGGAAGRILETYIDHLRGNGPRPTFLGSVDEGGKAAVSQMEQQMAGEFIAAPLGFLRRGGFLKNSADTMANLAKDSKLGTRLSGPELASGTHIGEISKSIQSYTSGAFIGGRIQAAARAVGNKSAIKVVDDALALLGHPGTSGGPTLTSKGTAYAARAFVGEQLSKAADAAPPIDISTVKQAAVQELQKGIVQHLKSVPDVANPKLAQLIREVRANPDLIQRAPRPMMTQLADLILEKFKSPSLQILRRIVGMEDSTPARAIWDETRSLSAMSRPADELYSKSDAQRIATHFKGQLRDSLAQAAPELSKALEQYRDLARGDELTRTVIMGGKALPKDEAGLETTLKGMAARLRTQVASGKIAREWGDPKGQQVIQNVKEVADILEKRSQPTAGPIRKIMELGRMMTIPIGIASGHLSGSMVTAATLWEGFPDFFTWVVHNPKATQWFIEGTTAKNPVQSAAAVVRLMDLYKQTQQPEKGPSGTPPPAR